MRDARERAMAGLSAIANPVSIKGIIAAVGGAIVLLLPTLTTVVVELVVLAFVILSGFVDLVVALGGRRRLGRERGRIVSLLRGIGSLLFAALLVMVAILTEGGASLGLTLLVFLVGWYVLARGLIVGIAAVFNKQASHRGIRITAGVTVAALGWLAIVQPETVSEGVIAGAAVFALIFGLLLVTWGLRRAEGAASRLDPRKAGVADALWDWIRGSDIGDMQREELSTTLYHEQPERLSKRFAWWTMLVLSVAIATFAVLADSTAVVIGAMLVAPLMAPILGLAGAIVNGWRWRAIESAAVVALGTTVSILLAYGLTAWAPAAINFDTNSQIVSRVNPTILDMLIALAAGAAGAFATVDKRVSSSIAGVAIAVALVPPLAVVGVALYGEHGDEARGAFLLFLTNFVAIVLSACVVFVLTGFARFQALRTNLPSILTTVIPFVAVAAVILVPLVFASEGLLTSSTRETQAQEVVDDWMGERDDLQVQTVRVDDDDVVVELRGSGSPPSGLRLQRELENAFGEPVAVTLRVTPVEEQYLEPNPLSEVLQRQSEDL
ncbi:DUF389 domain-containing protein [uncultured Demequina sp.]|uniref:DUF389 domain-containing protein n=1 Tax=uncultured Demequina sp. TaxID=693499 RepID=UPI0025F5CBB1|nr:DUF389 domain-containing protein [uncultured Demequina sp.]